ncbi:hypothetical protein M231_06652 [Tremella mesenterica]|uniref:Uncharacterized protein n=1 Tax=Tremella mesenterica TaxID=5217 RepID=A0A4Q1BDW9_TREME|nr:hypothetical protein M231_06652 [Tremella mesenterica]
MSSSPIDSTVMGKSRFIPVVPEIFKSLAYSGMNTIYTIMPNTLTGILSRALQTFRWQSITHPHVNNQRQPVFYSRLEPDHVPDPYLDQRITAVDLEAAVAVEEELHQVKTGNDRGTRGRICCGSKTIGSSIAGVFQLDDENRAVLSEHRFDPPAGCRPGDSMFKYAFHVDSGGEVQILQVVPSRFTGRETVKSKTETIRSGQLGAGYAPVGSLTAGFSHSTSVEIEKPLFRIISGIRSADPTKPGGPSIVEIHAISDKNAPFGLQDFRAMVILRWADSDSVIINVTSEHVINKSFFSRFRWPTSKLETTQPI